MKNSKEIADTVFKKRDEHLKKQTVRRRRIKKISYIGSTACLCAIILSGINHIGNNNEKIPSVPDTAILESTRDDTATEEAPEDSDVHSNTNNIETSSNITSDSTENVDTTIENETKQPFLNVDDNDTGSTVSETDPEESTHEQTLVSQPDYSLPSENEVRIPSTGYTPTEIETIVPSATYVPSTESETVVPPTENETNTEHMWDENTLTNQFHEVSYQNVIYTLRSATIDEEYINDSIDTITLSGLDSSSNTAFSITAYIYSIANISNECVVALKFEGLSKYHLYFNEYYCPKTLGMLIADLDLKNTITFGEMYYGYDSSITYPVNTYQTDQVLLFLDNSSQSLNLNDSSFHKKNVSFSTNLSMLGIIEKSMAFTEDGYFITNIMEQQYTFYVGEDEISNLISLLGVIQSDSTEHSGMIDETDITLE